MIRIIRARGQRITPWKNGGGITAEIAVGPPGAAPGAFDWRVSAAQVASDGAFSLFPGIDRTLAVLSGAGMRLTVDGAPPVTLTPQTPPFAFPGDLPASAQLLDGAVKDLNVMSRRGRFTHSLRRLPPGGPAAIEATGALTILVCFDGALNVGTEEGVYALGPGDALLGGPGPVWRLGEVTAGQAYWVEIAEVGGGAT